MCVGVVVVVNVAAYVKHNGQTQRGTTFKTQNLKVPLTIPNLL